MPDLLSLRHFWLQVSSRLWNSRNFLTFFFFPCLCNFKPYIIKYHCLKDQHLPSVMMSYQWNYPKNRALPERSFIPGYPVNAGAKVLGIFSGVFPSSFTKHQAFKNYFCTHSFWNHTQIFWRAKEGRNHETDCWCLDFLIKHFQGSVSSKPAGRCCWGTTCTAQMEKTPCGFMFHPPFRGPKESK